MNTNNRKSGKCAVRGEVNPMLRFQAKHDRGFVIIKLSVCSS